MGADVAERSSGPRLGGIGSPHGLLHPLLLMRIHEEVLQILDHHLSHGAHLAFGEHPARLTHQRIPRVVVSEGKHEPGRLHELDELSRLLDAVGHRLVTGNVESGLQKRLCHREMHAVRRNDGDEVDALALRKACLGTCHLLVIPVAA